MTKQEILESLKNIILEANLANFVEANKPVTDSRNIQSGDIFICINGFASDGHDYAQSAIDKGASIIISSRKLDLEIPQLIVKNSRQAAALLCKSFYNSPASKMKLIGVTGTNGKTTINHLFQQALMLMGKKVGSIGTLGYQIGDRLYSTDRTTPDIIELNQVLDQMQKAGIEYVIMEVSSHAIALNRTDCLDFDAGIFTNLTQDHLDFHPTLEHYAETKFRLFQQIKENAGFAIINTNDHYGKLLYEREHYKKIGISDSSKNAKIQNISTDLFGSKFTLVKRNQYQHFHTKLIGEYNIFNLTATILLIQSLFPDLELADLQEVVSQLDSVPGRLQKANSKPGVGVYVDYAHSPDALENVISTLKKVNPGRLICVFGAGGDRDAGKRPKMLGATTKADLTIITTDNPRTEEPANIIRDIISEKSDTKAYWIISDREQAIISALDLAHPGDIVLIAGKGHEKYQEIKGQRFDFDDVAIAESYKASNPQGLAVPIDSIMLEKIFGSNTELPHQIYYDISTDTRSIKPKSLFFALIGDKFNGHNFVDKALDTDGCLAVIDIKHKSDNPNHIKVNNTTEAYGMLATIYKKLFSIKSVAITGSYGKTTTKEYLYNILNNKHKTLKTFSNENNQVGLPKTIFRLSCDDYYAVFELGSNHFGEIKYLTNICRADINAITSVGPSHLEFFIDEAGVFKEKTSIFRGKNETRIFPGDDMRFRNLNGLTFGAKAECDFRITNVHHTDQYSTFKLNSTPYQIATPFKENITNASIAAAIAMELKFSSNEIALGLSKPLEVNNRMQILSYGEKQIISDCYNANPSSMKAALEFCNEYHKSKPHIAIIGDMLELGKLTRKHHKDIWKSLELLDYDKVISVGKHSKYYQADQHFDSIEKLIESQLYKKFPADSVILLKASRSIKLEKILDKL